MVKWDVLRDFLKGRYGECLGIDFTDFISFDPQNHIDSPAWLEIEDSISFADISIGGPGALLYDPQIGLLNFFFPFDTDATAKIHSQVRKALRLRSRLLAGPGSMSHKTDERENSSEIRLCMYWIAMSKKAYLAWIETIMSIRNQTANLEELVVDIIATNENEDLHAALNKHGLPRLLLQVRKVLKLNSIDEVYTWRSADVEVMRMLETFPDRFEDLDLRNLATDVVMVGRNKAREIAEERNDEESIMQPKKKFLGTLMIENFRNISNPIRIDLGAQDAHSSDSGHLIHAIPAA